MKFFCLKYLMLYTIAFCLFSACNGPFETKKIRIGFSQCIGDDQWRISMLKEMKRELNFHKDVDFLYYDANGESKTQIAQVEELVAKNIDLLIISPNEAEPLTEVVESVMKMGIPVIVIDRKIASNKYTAYVGADNFQIGNIAGHYIGAQYKRGANIVEIMGLEASSPAIDRKRGFDAAIAKYPQLEIKQYVHGDWLKDVAKARVAKDATILNEIDLVFAHNDQMALGVYEQLKAWGLHEKIQLIGVDALRGEGNGLDLIERGILRASVVYPTGGKEAIATAIQILNKQDYNANTLLKTTVIDGSNVQLMKMQEERMDKQQLDIERQQSMIDEQRQVYRGQRFTLNILVASLVLAVVFGGVAFYSLTLNWRNNKQLENQNREIIANERRLLEMTNKAAEANEAKMQFFTNVSHEFRTPITLMLLPIEELLKERNLTSQAKDRLLLLQRSARRILKIVNELIDFKKIGDEKMQLQLSKIDVIAFVKEIVQVFENAAKQKHIDLRVLSKSRTLYGTVDTQLFDRVLFNLLGNAIKFTPKYGHVYISVDSSDDELFLKIEDSGLGMTEAELEHAFEPFYQGKNVGVTGSGLGLSLCRDIIVLHQGHIQLKSEKGKGTICEISVPIRTLENEAITDVKNLINEEISKTYVEGVVPQVETKLEEKRKPIHDKLILLIEDNVDMRNFLLQALSVNFEVIGASNGVEGFEFAADHVPDLIISDVLMPERDGVELSTMLKNDLRTSHIPIILLTARTSDEQKIAGINSLADAYMSKPFNMDVLFATIQNMFKNRGILKEKFTSDISSNTQRDLGKLDKKFINDLSSIVEENLANEGLSVDDISNAMGLSRVQLYRKAKVLLDCTIAEYILNRRLQKAKYLLTNEKELSIADVTFQTGFASPNYFSTVFKSKYGLTPSDFKKGAV